MFDLLFLLTSNMCVWWTQENTSALLVFYKMMKRPVLIKYIFYIPYFLC